MKHSLENPGLMFMPGLVLATVAVMGAAGGVKHLTEPEHMSKHVSGVVTNVWKTDDNRYLVTALTKVTVKDGSSAKNGTMLTIKDRECFVPKAQAMSISLGSTFKTDNCAEIGSGVSAVTIKADTDNQIRNKAINQVILDARGKKLPYSAEPKPVAKTAAPRK